MIRKFFQFLCGNILFLTGMSSYAQPTSVSDGVPGNVVELQGILTLGTFDPDEKKALTNYAKLCEASFLPLKSNFEEHRFAELNSGRRVECTRPKNIYPDPSKGYLFASYGDAVFAADNTDILVPSDGPSFESLEYGEDKLHEANKGFQLLCRDKIAELVQQMGTSLAVAYCGEAQVVWRETVDTSTRKTSRFLKIKSVIKLFRIKDVSWDVSKQQKLTSNLSGTIAFPNHLLSLTPSIRNTQLLYATDDRGGLAKIDLKNRRLAWHRNLVNPDPTSKTTDTRLTASALAQDESVLAVAGDYGFLGLIDTESGLKRSVLNCTANLFESKHYQAVAFNRNVTILYAAAKHDSKPEQYADYADEGLTIPVLERARSERFVESWDTANGKIRWKIAYDGGPILGMGLSQDERLLYIFSIDMILILNAQDGSFASSFDLQHHASNMYGLAAIEGVSFSTDFRLAAVATESFVLVLNTENAKLVAKLRAPQKLTLHSPRFFDNDRKVSAMTMEGEIYEWNLLSQEVIGRGADKIVFEPNWWLTPVSLLAPDHSFLLGVPAPNQGSREVPFVRNTPLPANSNVCASEQEGVLRDFPSVDKSVDLSVWRLIR